MSALRLFIDSGCSWHVHNDVRDLINIRSSAETVWDAGGKPHLVSAIGDMPVVAKDSLGRSFRVLLRDVRIVDDYDYSLISVDQLWCNSRIDCVFRDVRSLIVPSAAADEPPKLSLSCVPTNRINGM